MEDYELVILGAIIGALLSLVVGIILFLLQKVVADWIDSRKTRKIVMESLLTELKANVGIFSEMRETDSIFSLMDDVLRKTIANASFNRLDDYHLQEFILLRCEVDLFNQAVSSKGVVSTELFQKVDNRIKNLISTLEKQLKI